jgi:hypothetical protein
MPYTCKRCQHHFPRALRAAGACPHCGIPFETAELTALCIGLTLSFLLALVLPELGRALLHPGSWHGPSDTVVLVRAALVTVVLAAGVLFLSAKYALWQGAALTAHPRLRLLWLAAFPGAVFAGLVLLVGVAFVALKHRQPPRRSLTVFLAER